jgi:hypothetical protein
MEGDRPFPRIPPALNSRRAVESSQRLGGGGEGGLCNAADQQLAEGLQLARMRREASSDVGPIARWMRYDRGGALGRVPRLAHRRVILFFWPMRASSWSQISMDSTSTAYNMANRDSAAASLPFFCEYTRVVGRLGPHERRTGRHGALVVGVQILGSGIRGAVVLGLRRARVCSVRKLP